MKKKKSRIRHRIGDKPEKILSGDIVAWTFHNAVVRVGKCEFLVPKSQVHHIDPEDLEQGYRISESWDMTDRGMPRYKGRTEKIEIPKRIVEKLKKRKLLSSAW